MNGHIEKISAGLRQYGVDAMLICGRANLFYCFGFEADEGDGLGIISEGGSWYFTDGRYFEDAVRQMDGITVMEIPKYSSYLRQVGKILHRNELSKIGYEESMSVRNFNSCKNYLYGELIPAEELISEARACKDPEEIEKLRCAQKIADEAFTEFLNYLHPGITERAAASKLEIELLRCGADALAFPALVQSGPNGSHPHLRPSNRALQEGEFVTVDFGCIKDGYCSDTTRTVALKSADSELKAVYEAVLEAQNAGMQSAVVGGLLADADSAARNTISQRGFDGCYDHAFGHGIGIEAHEAPFSGIGINGRFAENVVMTAEPGVYLKNKLGVRIEDTFTVTQNGIEIFSSLERSMLIIK